MKSSQSTLARSHWEWKICVAVWTVAAVWTLSVSWMMGYHEGGETGPLPSIVLGMPAWVFWGIFCPWLAVTLITIGLGLLMQDDDSAAGSDPKSSGVHGPASLGERSGSSHV